MGAQIFGLSVNIMRAHVIYAALKSDIWLALLGSCHARSIAVFALECSEKGRKIVISYAYGYLLCRFVGVFEKPPCIFHSHVDEILMRRYFVDVFEYANDIILCVSELLRYIRRFYL